MRSRSGPACGPVAEQNLDQLPTLDDVRSAAEVLTGIVRTTPVTSSVALSDRLGTQVLLKHEEHQRTGSFKLRGAYNRLVRLHREQGGGAVVAASAGNHAQGVALAASLLGIEATVFMPAAAPLPKVEATRGYGAEVVLGGFGVQDALIAAREFATRTGSVFIHPFDHPDVIAGQGTIGLELAEQCPQLGTVLVPVGGGGLIAGTALALKQLRPDVRVIGVQAAGAAAFGPSLAAGHPVTLSDLATMADGIAVATPGHLTVALAQHYVDEVVTVTEAQIARALLLLLERSKRVVEPAGAVAVAALLDDDRARELPGPVLAVVSGGNIDPLLMMRVVRFGMASAGRYLQLRLALPDRPGALANLLALLAEHGANVLEVEHLRHGVLAHVDEVIVALRLETLGHAHSERVLAAISEAGYTDPGDTGSH